MTKILIMTSKEKEIYWKGFEDGKKNSIKHNINLLKSQLDKKQRGKKKPQNTRIIRTSYGGFVKRRRRR